MDIHTLEKIVVDALEDIKGKAIEVIDTQQLTPLFERMVIATGDSNRQVRSLADNVQKKVREAGGSVVSVEGEDSGEWVLVDLGEMIVHVMQPATRAYYNLEELWQASPAQPRKPALAPAREA
ncbi:ribosome silencing factor [Azonexus sp.]|uniref:ribosome silencing factor n=1 Tax=Azonexus sp. TaxID=1872668 RepID=UPI0039E603FC